jgi:hypothetical protein
MLKVLWPPFDNLFRFCYNTNMDNFPYYADFLLRLKNHLFPPLTYKGVDFYRWYWDTRKQRRYEPSDCVDLANELASLPPASSPLDALAEWLQHLPISDASAVLDAIERRTLQAQQRPLSFPDGLTAGAIEAVRQSLSALADEMQKTDKKT